jgi:hypothetical protein
MSGRGGAVRADVRAEFVEYVRLRSPWLRRVAYRCREPVRRVAGVCGRAPRPRQRSPTACSTASTAATCARTAAVTASTAA